MPAGESRATERPAAACLLPIKISGCVWLNDMRGKWGVKLKNLAENENWRSKATPSLQHTQPTLSLTHAHTHTRTYTLTHPVDCELKLQSSQSQHAAEKRCRKRIKHFQPESRDGLQQPHSFTLSFVLLICHSCSRISLTRETWPSSRPALLPATSRRSIPTELRDLQETNRTTRRRARRPPLTITRRPSRRLRATRAKLFVPRKINRQIWTAIKRMGRLKTPRRRCLDPWPSTRPSGRIPSARPAGGPPSTATRSGPPQSRTTPRATGRLWARPPSYWEQMGTRLFSPAPWRG